LEKLLPYKIIRNFYFQNKKTRAGDAVSLEGSFFSAKGGE